MDIRDKPKRKILIKLEILLRGRTCPGGLPDKSRKTYWNPLWRPDISGIETGHIWDENRTIRFANPDTPVLTGMRIKWNSGKI
jgi:hypothetical protein